MGARPKAGPKLPQNPKAPMSAMQWFCCFVGFPSFGAAAGLGGTACMDGVRGKCTTGLKCIPNQTLCPKALQVGGGWGPHGWHGALVSAPAPPSQSTALGSVLTAPTPPGCASPSHPISTPPHPTAGPQRCPEALRVALVGWGRWAAGGDPPAWPYGVTLGLRHAGTGVVGQHCREAVHTHTHTHTHMGHTLCAHRAAHTGGAAPTRVCTCAKAADSDAVPACAHTPGTDAVLVHAPTPDSSAVLVHAQTPCSHAVLCMHRHLTALLCLCMHPGTSH